MFGNARVAALLAASDIKMLYRRSTFGPLWLTFTLGAQIMVVGFVFSSLFEGDRLDYFLYFGIGLTFWLFVTSTINDSATSLVNSGTLIKQVRLPISTHVYRVVIKNLFLLAHNFIVLVPLFVLASDRFNAWSLMVFPSLLLSIINLIWVSLSVAILSARFRDLPPVVNGFIVIAFYATPILWRPQQFEGTTLFNLISLNPFFHLVEAFRQPLLGLPVESASILYLAVSSVVGGLFTLLIRSRMEKNVPFWV